MGAIVIVPEPGYPFDYAGKTYYLRPLTVAQKNEYCGLARRIYLENAKATLSAEDYAKKEDLVFGGGVVYWTSFPSQAVIGTMYNPDCEAAICRLMLGDQLKELDDVAFRAMLDEVAAGGPESEFSKSFARALGASDPKAMTGSPTSPVPKDSTECTLPSPSIHLNLGSPKLEDLPTGKHGSYL